MKTVRTSKENTPSKPRVHSASIARNVNKNSSSSQITEVSIHTDPHIHIPNIDDVTDHYSNQLEITDGTKSDNAGEVLANLEETTDYERRHRKKKKKKKKIKKNGIELKEDSDLNHNTRTLGVNDTLDSIVDDNDVRNSARLAFDHSISQDTLQRLDTDLL